MGREISIVQKMNKMGAVKKHQKHTNLAKAHLGFFARNEWAIIGTSCGNIKKVAYQLTKILSKDYKVAYVDADYADEQNKVHDFHRQTAGPQMQYTNKISHHQFSLHAHLESYQYRYWFNEQDLVIVNGNHFKAKQQIVVIDPQKKASLSRKLDRLTNVSFILLMERDQEIFDFLQEYLPNLAEIPVCSIEETEAVGTLLRKQMENAVPPLYGLVLAGGKSTRMGSDKGLIDYHGKPQREYVADLLGPYCEEVFISCRADQMNDIPSPYQGLSDQLIGLGPFGGISSAFQQNPNAAWLVVACDLPLLDENTLAQLVKGRNVSKIATAFNSPHNEFPEPLITIWEPKSYPILMQFLAQGYSCPRKVLIHSDVELLDADDKDRLMNVNNPAEKKQVDQLIIK